MTLNCWPNILCYTTPMLRRYYRCWTCSSFFSQNTRVKEKEYENSSLICRLLEAHWPVFFLVFVLFCFCLTLWLVPVVGCRLDAWRAAGAMRLQPRRQSFVCGVPSKKIIEIFNWPPQNSKVSWTTNACQWSKLFIPYRAAGDVG